MKKILLLLSSVFLYSAVNAQYIQNVRLMPQYPGPSDSVRVLLDLEFSSGDCQLTAENHSVNNDSVQIDVFHCPGPLAFICDVTDTINLGLLPVGTYNSNIIVHKKNYFSPDPCAGSSPVDSIALPVNVYPISGIDQNSSAKAIAWYDFSNNMLRVYNAPTGSANITLFDSRGLMIRHGSFNLQNGYQVNGLSRGIYFYKIETSGNKILTGKFIYQH